VIGACFNQVQSSLPPTVPLFYISPLSDFRNAAWATKLRALAFEITKLDFGSHAISC
jgi:hypothetical protein